MSLESECAHAEEMLRLRQTVAGLQRALRDKDDALSVEWRKRERLERVVNLYRVRFEALALELEQLAQEI